MPNESDAVKTAVEAINNEANRQILSHCVMALKQNIEDRLKEGGDANSQFEEKIKSFSEENSNRSYKAYVYLDDFKDDFKNNTFARIYPKIDKVFSVEGEDISYALHLRITSHGTGTTFYKEGFIAEDCGRFAIGHDIEHAFLNLNDLICNVTTNDNQNITKSELADNTTKYCELILKEITPSNYDKINDIIEKIFSRIKEVFKKSKELYYDSLQYTMSHPIIALNKIINSEFQLKIHAELEKLREKLREKSNECELAKKSIISAVGISEKIFTKIIDIEKQMDDLTKQMDDLENKNPRINIHLISRETHGKDLTIDCYNRRDESSGKDFYCFEIVIKKFSEEEKNNHSKEICKAIGFIYFSYKSIIKRFENNNSGHFGGTISEMLKNNNDFCLSEEKLNNFANELCKLRNKNFEDKCENIKTESELKVRLDSYVV